MTVMREIIEVTAGEVADELKRRGIGSDEKVTLTIEPETEILRRSSGIACARRRGGAD